MTTTTAANMFNNIIGQDAAKRKLSFFIDGYRKRRTVPHVLLTAPKGTGKTMLAKELQAICATLVPKNQNLILR